MTAPSLLGLSAALAFVLGVLVLLAYAVRHLVPHGRGGSGAGRIEVLGRVALAPRQGVATIRVAGRTTLVSYGEGGVRLLAELGRCEESNGTLHGEPGEQATDVALVSGRSLPFASALSRAGRTAAGMRALGLGIVLAFALCAATPAGVTAQEEGGASSQSADPRSLPQLSLSLDGGDGEGLKLSGPVGTVIFVGFLTLIPTLLLLMTSFTRILIVLHLLKQALGTQTAPPAHLLAAMALLLTGFVMAPTFGEVNRTALAPWVAGKIDEAEMLRAAAIPMRSFMLRSTREQDLAQFVDMRAGPRPQTVDEIPTVVLTSAFVTSELTSAFQMGFALFLPFVVIDVVVASVLMSMGMFMLPPVMVSLPFKLLLFVLVDGWSLVVGSLVQSF